MSLKEELINLIKKANGIEEWDDDYFIHVSEKNLHIIRKILENIINPNHKCLINIEFMTESDIEDVYIEFKIS